MINLRRSFTYLFEDKDWVAKLLISTGIYLVPVLNFALNGYALEALRNTARGEDVPLPKWDDMGKYFADGLKLFAAQLIYTIPMLGVFLVMVVLGLSFGISTQDMARSARDSMSTGFGILMISLACLILLYGLFYAFITPAVQIQIARTGEIRSAFRFDEMLALFTHRKAGYLLAFLLPTIPGFVLGIILLVLVALPVLLVCLYLPITAIAAVLTPYLTLVSRHWYGQLLRD